MRNPPLSTPKVNAGELRDLGSPVIYIHLQQTEFN